MAATSNTRSTRFTMVVQGGAGSSYGQADAEKNRQQGVKDATLKGYRILQRGGSAVDAVEEAISVMEDSPIFNAGRGSCQTADKTIEMDAFIMAGRDQSIGSVGGVSKVPNPVRLARAIMERTPHCMFIGKQADELAANRLHIKPVNPDIWNNSLDRSWGTTPGAVALDRLGNLAAATSTGGLVGRLSGRLGDTALPGCSCWADNQSCAVCVTGRGEDIMRACLAHRCALTYQVNGCDPIKAAKESLEYLSQRMGSLAGLIVVDPHGNIAIEFTTQRMAWAYCREGENLIHYGISSGDDLTEILQDK